MLHEGEEHKFPPSPSFAQENTKNTKPRWGRGGLEGM